MSMSSPNRALRRAFIWPLLAAGLAGAVLAADAGTSREPEILDPATVSAGMVRVVGLPDGLGLTSFDRPSLQGAHHYDAFPAGPGRIFISGKRVSDGENEWLELSKDYPSDPSWWILARYVEPWTQTEPAFVYDDTAGLTCDMTGYGTVAITRSAITIVSVADGDAGRRDLPPVILKRSTPATQTTANAWAIAATDDAGHPMSVTLTATEACASRAAPERIFRVEYNDGVRRRCCLR
ncbi:hypothetical protein sos41_30760 [Alphaproteobacteria bacterium SO-S41]|nr:hypothetical protein sos41_30760 [Alphaproteobacteria bacterium SO-S41]